MGMGSFQDYVGDVNIMDILKKEKSVSIVVKYLLTCTLFV